MKLNLVIDKGEIAKAKEHVLEEAQKKSKLKGFREGKAPLKLVEESIGQKQIQESIIEHVLPEAYAREVKKAGIKPISYPKFSLKKVVDGDDWEFEAEVAERPEIKLEDYKKEVKKAKADVVAKQAKDNIWVPGKDNPALDKSPETQGKQLEKQQDELLRAVFDALLKSVKFEVPQILVDEEVNRSLSRLLNQVGKLGLTVEQYLESMGTTSDKLRAEYARTAEETLRLELILQDVANDLKVTVDKKDIDKMIDSVGDSETKKKLDTPSERAGIEAMLVKRKTVDQLLAL